MRGVNPIDILYSMNSLPQQTQFCCPTWAQTRTDLDPEVAPVWRHLRSGSMGSFPSRRWPSSISIVRQMSQARISRGSRKAERQFTPTALAFRDRFVDCGMQTL